MRIILSQDETQRDSAETKNAICNTPYSNSEKEKRRVKALSLNFSPY